MPASFIVSHLRIYRKSLANSTRIHMFNQFPDNFDENSTEKWVWDETNSEQNHFGGSIEYGWD